MNKKIIGNSENKLQEIIQEWIDENSNLLYYILENKVLKSKTDK